jgi:hypothetical protein
VRSRLVRQNADELPTLGSQRVERCLIQRRFGWRPAYDMTVLPGRSDEDDWRLDVNGWKWLGWRCRNRRDRENRWHGVASRRVVVFL